MATSPISDSRTTSQPEPSPLRQRLRASELLEDVGLRHCIVGDCIAQVLGSPVLVGDIFIAVADGQLEEGRRTLAGAGFKTVTQRGTYFDYIQDEKDERGWPGYAFCPASEERDTGPSTTHVMLVAASAWGLDLEPQSFSVNTFLLPGSRYRGPSCVFYICGLINRIAERFEKPCFSQAITAYLQLQYAYVVEVLPPDLLASLPPADRLFIELFHKVKLRSAKRAVCDQWSRVQHGLTSVDAARKCIPRPDLRLPGPGPKGPW